MRKGSEWRDVPDTLEAHEEALLALADDDEVSNYRKGYHWSRIVDGELWRNAQGARYAGPEDYFRRKLKTKLKERELELFADVARTFDEPAAHLGMAMLDLLRRYRIAHGTAGRRDDPSDEPIAVPKGAKTITKRFADCTASELRRAIAGPAKPKAKEPPLPQSALLDMVRMMRNSWLVTDGSELEARMRNGQVMVNLGWFPLATLGDFTHNVDGVLDEWIKEGIPNGELPKPKKKSARG